MMYPQVTEILEIILKKRGIDSLDNFLKDENPLNFIRSFPAEFKIGLQQAKVLVEHSMKSKMPIVIMGDYDADGICATSILFNFLSKEKQYEKTVFFIPNRFDHGYGLSKGSIDAALLESAEKFGSQKVLFISVDSGITSVGEVAYIKSLGHQIIITDHHQKSEIVPEADALIWSDKVVGATISWILTQVLGSKQPDSLALAALATVTDVYPLIEMNRAVVKRGLKIINLSPPIGLKELIQVSGLSGKKIDSYELGWSLGPRINASGRLAEAECAVRLFTENDSKVRNHIAQQLNQINVQRQQETTRMYDLLSPHEVSSKFILFAKEDFHEGIIGLVASRLVKEYYKPSIVISLNGNYGKGSVRSIPGVNIISLLREFEDLFENLGGHPMAAGFTILREKITLLEENLLSAFESNFRDDLFVPSVGFDTEIPLKLVDWPLYEALEKLKPYGEGNPMPRFLTKHLGIAGIDFVGKEKNHTSLKLYDGDRYMKGIFFSSSDKFNGLGLGDYIDVVYSIKLNEFNGKRALDLFIEEITPSS